MHLFTFALQILIVACQPRHVQVSEFPEHSRWESASSRNGEEALQHVACVA